jgi:hypothetical protein
MQALPTRLKEEFPAKLLQGDSDMGSGPNVWNWHAMGVSKSLWNMVKGCLKSGMSKDAILHIINAIQNPLKDDREKQEEEEEEEGPGEDAQGISSVPQPDPTTLPTSQVRAPYQILRRPDSHGIIRTLLMNTITRGKLTAPRQKRAQVRPP